MQWLRNKLSLNSEIVIVIRFIELNLKETLKCIKYN